MSKKSKKSKSSKKANNKWFIKVRGSYLPVSWQAWGCFLVTALYLSISLAYIDELTDDLVWIAFHGLKDVAVAGIVLTWIAQQKS